MTTILNLKDLPILNIVDRFHILKELGRGGEGVVYLVEEKETHKKLVLKVFHKPHPREYLPGLPIYAERIDANHYGLPEVELIFNKDEITGIVYPYIQLWSLHWRILNSMEWIAQSIVGSYCKKQYFLMSTHNLVLWDPVLTNFMVDRYGVWNYTDIGGGICPLHHPWARQHGVIGYGFTSLLMSIYQKELFKLVPIVDHYSYQDPCIYINNDWIIEIAKKHKWVQEIRSEILSHGSEIYYDPEFYNQLGERLPDRVSWPTVILPLSQTLKWLGELRGKSKLSIGHSG